MSCSPDCKTIYKKDNPAGRYCLNRAVSLLAVRPLATSIRRLERINGWRDSHRAQIPRTVSRLELVSRNPDDRARRDAFLIDQGAVHANSVGAAQIFDVPPAAVHVEQTVVM